MTVFEGINNDLPVRAEGRIKEGKKKNKLALL